MILQDALPMLAWMDPRLSRLPGIQPVTDDSWLVVDEVFAAQMAERDRLIAQMPERVIGMLPEAAAAVAELYATVLAKLARTAGYRVGTGEVMRPDGVVIALDAGAPLHTLGRLVQEDLCVMLPQAGTHILAAAVLCFPASWTLSEKLGRSMLGIHTPVQEYDGDLAKRVQRLFDAIRPEQPLWRMNYNIYADATLFHPKSESDPHSVRRAGKYVRSERQCLLRLPQTSAVLFSIHTYQVALDGLAADERAALVAKGKLLAL